MASPAFPAFPPALPSLVAKTYAKALAAGDLTFTASARTSDISLRNVTYRLRFCPSLLHKPQNLTPDPTKPKLNPFLPPRPGLLVASTPGYNIVLNRFPIIAQHFLLCTAEFQVQTEPLRPEDVAAVYAVLREWEIPGERLYGFFNSGAMSGASQPHRHVQFFPIGNERGRLPFDEAPARGGEVWIHPHMPFRCFCIRFSEKPGVQEVVGAYQTLLKKCWELLGEGCDYNMGIMREWIVMLPRVSDDGGRPGVGINGTVLAGEIMVKKQEDWDFFVDGGLESVLRGIGVPNDGSAEGKD